MSPTLDPPGSLMELRQLRFVVALADELHFGRAAERMHIAQPAFSEQIRRLEREVGARLFDRTSHYVRLTDAGRLFLDEIRPALAQVEHAAAVATRAGQGILGALRIGLTGNAAHELTSLALRAFTARHPAIAVDVCEFPLSDPCAGLEAREADVAFIRLPLPGLHPALVVEPLLDERRVAVVPGDHPLAGASSLALEALACDPFVTGPRPTGLGSGAAAGPVANTTEEWLSFITAGLGVSLAPASSERLHGRAGVAFVPVSDAAAATLAVAHHRENDAPTVRAFTAVARAAAARLERPERVAAIA